MGYMSSAHRDGIRRAIADRERGRSKVRSTTTAVTMASVVTAGALALVLPGSTHKTDRLDLDRLDRLDLLEFRLLRFHLIRLDQLGFDQLGFDQLGFDQLRFDQLRLDPVPTRARAQQFGLVLFLERPQFGFHSGLELG